MLRKRRRSQINNVHTFAAKRLEGLPERWPARRGSQGAFAGSKPRDICRAGGSKWLREVHAAESCRRHGFSYLRSGAGGRNLNVVLERCRVDAIAARKGRLHLSVISIAPHPYGF